MKRRTATVFPIRPARRGALLCLALAAALSASPSASQLPEPLRGVGLDQRLNELLPLNSVFRDETGQEVRLGRYFQSKPVVLSLVYFECPMLCTLELNGLVKTLRALSLRPGRDFELVTVSFHPKDTPAMAAAKKAVYIRSLDQPEAASGWHFLTGGAESIAALTQAAGFRYRTGGKSGEYAHASGILVLTPEGRLSRYFYGVDFSPRDLKLALLEASDGRIASPVAQVLLYCFHYDAATGKYTLLIWRLIQVAGMLVLLILCTAIWALTRWDRRRRLKEETVGL